RGLSVLRVRRVRLQRGNRRHVENVITGGSAREIATGAAQALNDRPDGNSATESLHQLVGDVSRIQGWEDEHVRSTCNRAARSLSQPDVVDERGITLQFSVHDQGRRSPPDLGQCVRHKSNTWPIGTTLGTEREERNAWLI